MNRRADSRLTPSPIRDAFRRNLIPAGLAMLAAVLLCGSAPVAAAAEYRAFWVDAWGAGFLNQSQVDTLLGVPGTTSKGQHPRRQLQHGHRPGAPELRRLLSLRRGRALHVRPLARQLQRPAGHDQRRPRHHRRQEAHRGPLLDGDLPHQRRRGLSASTATPPPAASPPSTTTGRAATTPAPRPATRPSIPAIRWACSTPSTWPWTWSTTSTLTASTTTTSASRPTTRATTRPASPATTPATA